MDWVRLAVRCDRTIRVGRRSRIACLRWQSGDGDHVCRVWWKHEFLHADSMGGVMERLQGLDNCRHVSRAAGTLGPIALAFLCGLAPVVAVGCSRPVALPDWCGSRTGCVDVELIDAPQGVLHERAGCIWLVAVNGAEFAVLWPPGYVAEFSPFEVKDGLGHRVAVEGSTIRYNVIPESRRDVCGRAEWVAVSFGQRASAS
jgi:hypothetical protein